LLPGLLSIALFAFWALLGYAAIAWTRAPLDPVRRLLVGPAVGMVLNALPLMLLSMAGLPLSHVAVPVLGGLSLLALVLLWRAGEGGRRFPSYREYLPFAGILIAALLLTGRPMLQFGFDWVSFCNDDMANYVMGAQRLLDHGYFAVPTADRLLGGYDFSEYLYFLHVPGMHRPGSEMLLAFASRLTGVATPQVFMPVAMAIHLVLVSGVAGMACEDVKTVGEEFENDADDDRWHVRRNAPALAAAALVGCSALATLGTLYQLIAQVAGLGVLTACATLLMRSFGGFSRGQIVRYGVLLGLLVAGLTVMYAEIAPFLALGYGLFAIIGILRQRLPVWPMLGTAAVAVPTALLALNRFVPTTIAYIMRQAGTGVVPEDPQLTLFPYYLMPTGLANLWGFQRVATAMAEPLQSLAIGAGALLLILVVAAALWRTWQGSAPATFVLVMLFIGVLLFRA
jgi:hypothetical protein